jgi:hypothetical protein
MFASRQREILEAQAHVGITRTNQLPLRCPLPLSRI